MSEVPWLEPLADWCAADEITVSPACGAALASSALDFAGALIAGAAHPLHAAYIGAFAAGGGAQAHGPGCKVLGDARFWPVADAAAANAAISHFWEVDDSHRTATMHPGITVYPAVLALAQHLPGISATRMREAVVAGYEVGTRIGTLLGKAHYATCHTTATAGCFSAAAAAARMLRLDAGQTLAAFGHAGTQAAGLWQFLDDGAVDAKPFHAATAVRNGIAAAFLAQAGVAGAARILEGRRGMFAAWGLTGAPGGALTPGDGFEITRATIKGWPVCGQMHSLLDATAHLVRARRFDAAGITRVLVEVPTPLLDIADVKRPETISAMKFSTSYCVALLLAGATLPFSGLPDSLLDVAPARELAERIEVVADPGFDRRFPKERPARITLWLADGGSYVEERSFRRGDPEAPWPWDALVERFKDITGIADATPASQDAVIKWCASFGAGGDFDPAAGAIFRAVRAR